MGQGEGALVSVTGAAVCLLDARPTGGVLERAQGHRDQAQPDRRDPARRRFALAAPRDLVWRAGRPRVRGKKGRIERLSTAPPESSIVVCLDEMGPVSAKSYPGRGLVRSHPHPQAGLDKRSTTADAAKATSSAPSALQLVLPSRGPTRAGAPATGWPS